MNKRLSLSPSFMLFPASPKVLKNAFCGVWSIDHNDWEGQGSIAFRPPSPNPVHPVFWHFLRLLQQQPLCSLLSRLFCVVCRLITCISFLFRWLTCCSYLDYETVAGADKFGNVFVVSTSGGTRLL